MPSLAVVSTLAGTVTATALLVAGSSGATGASPAQPAANARVTITAPATHRIQSFVFIDFIIEISIPFPDIPCRLRATTLPPEPQRFRERGPIDHRPAAAS